MITILITSFNEPKTIARAIRALADSSFSQYEGEFEVLQVSPDKETLDAGKREAVQLKLGDRYRQIVDPHKGKPHALNLALRAARGDIIVLTDGDTSFGEGALKHLLTPFEDRSIGGVTGQPIPTNARDTYWGYLAHCFTSAADHRRRNIFSVKKDEYFISVNRAFPLSGYIFAIRNLNLKLPKGLAIDDTYISYSVFNRNFKLAYSPLAHAYVKFPTNFSDYVKQRRRNLLGHQEMSKHLKGLHYRNERSFLAELGYVLYPLLFAKSIKELLWSFSMYPLRMLTWLYVWRMKLSSTPIMSKQGWERTESTK